MAAARRRTIPLVATALVALVAVAAAAWLVFFAPAPRSVGDEATLPVPEQAPPAPMPTPTVPATRR